MKLESSIIKLEHEKQKILKKIEKRNQNRKIKCMSCNNMHVIRTLDLIQTHWYTSPYGCTGGDHWNSGELQFICPTTGIRNRLLFNNYDVPWEKRNHYAHDPEEQFKRNYKHLFKSVKDTYKDEEHAKTTNNYYIDTHRKTFGLVEKHV